MKRNLLLLVCVVLLLAGCRKRQTASRLVYISVPAAANASNVAPAAAESIVIGEPEPPEEAKAIEPTDAETETTTKRAVRHRRPGALRPDAPAEAEEAPAAPQPPPAEVPALEPQKSPEEQTQLRREISASRDDTERRLAQLDHMTLGAGDRKTLDDARAFLTQAQRALDEGELVRSANLTRKAALLVSAVEQSH